MLSDLKVDPVTFARNAQGSSQVWVRALLLAVGMALLASCSSSVDPATNSDLRASSACRTLTNYSRNGIPALYIDEGTALLGELANDFFSMGRSDVSNGIEQIIALTYVGPLGQIQAKTKLSQLSQKYCSAQGSDLVAGNLGEESLETTIPPTTAPIQTTTTTTLSPEAVREMARKRFEQLPEYQTSEPSVMFEACDTIFGFLADGGYVQHYEFLQNTLEWFRWREFDFPGQILGMQLFEFTGDNVPEVFVTANYAPENQVFGLVLSHWPDQCDSWRKTGIYSPSSDFAFNSIVDPALNGSTLTGSRDGVSYSYTYDRLQDAIVETPR